MDKYVEAGKILLVNGPASITLLKGKTTLFGASISLERKVIVRTKQTMPFEVEEDSTFKVILGAEGQAEKIVFIAIPNCWENVNQEILSLPKFCVVMVLGDINSGKANFCTFIANKALIKGLKPAVINADLGLSDFGFSTTIALSLISNPITDFFALKPNTLFFIDKINPSSITDRLIEGITALIDRAKEVMSDIIIVNTDSWVEGEDAKHYKAVLIEKIFPQAVVGIQQSNELEHILSPAKLSGLNVYRVGSSFCTKNSNKEERKVLREQGYRKFFDGSVLRNIPLGWIELEYTPLGTGIPLVSNRLEVVEKSLKCKTIYCEENSKEIFIVHGENEISNDTFLKVEEIFKKKLFLVKDGEEKGLLVGLLDKNRHFLGLGIINKIDYKNRILKVYTSYKAQIDLIQFGQIKIDEKGNELGITKAFST